MYKGRNLPRKRQFQGGFTLVELLVVMAMVSVLGAIAVPQYKNYRSNSFDAAARNDLRNAAMAEEAYFVDNASYKTCSDLGCPAALPGMHALSPGVHIAMTGTVTGFSGTANHPSGLAVYTWDSQNGGMQQ